MKMENFLRKCAKCGELKPVFDFPVEPRIQGGRQIKCYRCALEDAGKFERKSGGKKWLGVV